MKMINTLFLPIKIFSVVLTTVIALSFAYADTASSPLLSLIRKNYNPITPFETKLSLNIYWSVREKEEKKQGSLLLAPGDRFRVTVGNETYVSDGTTLWTYNAGANQVIIETLADVDPSIHPSRLFMTYIEKCPFREQGQSNGTAQLSWKSDSSSAAYASIRIWVQLKTGTITKCIMTDRNKNLFTYTFTGTVFGKKAPGEAFDFVIPDKARVIDKR